MEIEKPEHPIIIPAAAELLITVPKYATIGDFYMAIQEKVKVLPDSAFKNADLQVTADDYYSPSLLFKITNAEEAVKAIGIIIEQGEGTDTSPEAPVIDGTGEPAHYYRFQQIVKGRLLINAPVKGYVFGGDKINAASVEVYPLWDNTKIKDLESYPAEWKALNDFNLCYTGLLVGLDNTFNGNPAGLEDTIDIMRNLKKLAKKLVTLSFPGKAGYNIGPSFEYTV
jgi:hypothetical protein